MGAVPIDADRQVNARRRADRARQEAAYLRRQADAEVAKAEQIERTWGIPEPCLACGQRPGTPGCRCG